VPELRLWLANSLTATDFLSSSHSDFSRLSFRSDADVSHLSFRSEAEESASPLPDAANSHKLPAWVRNEMKTVETELKYAGYLEQQRKSMAKLKRDEQRVIPPHFDYAACSGLSREMVETLSRVRPQTLGQASRIQGVTPAAVSLINCFLEIHARRRP
jgi:tRNA uridine 5-carboxymethylaminomethyl modification enzyme